MPAIIFIINKVKNWLEFLLHIILDNLLAVIIPHTRWNSSAKRPTYHSTTQSTITFNLDKLHKSVSIVSSLNKIDTSANKRRVRSEEAQPER